jgi:hypothetical protein
MASPCFQLEALFAVYKREVEALYPSPPPGQATPVSHARYSTHDDTMLWLISPLLPPLVPPPVAAREGVAGGGFVAAAFVVVVAVGRAAGPVAPAVEATRSVTGRLVTWRDVR